MTPHPPPPKQNDFTEVYYMAYHAYPYDYQHRLLRFTKIYQLWLYFISVLTYFHALLINALIYNSQMWHE